VFVELVELVVGANVGIANEEEEAAVDGPKIPSGIVVAVVPSGMMVGRGGKDGSVSFVDGVVLFAVTPPATSEGIAAPAVTVTVTVVIVIEETTDSGIGSKDVMYEVVVGVVEGGGGVIVTVKV